MAPGGFLGFLETGQTLLAINVLLPSLALCMRIDISSLFAIIIPISMLFAFTTAQNMAQIQSLKA